MPNFPEPSYGGSYWGGQSYGVSRPRNDPNHHIQSVPAHAGTSIRQHDQYPLQGSRSAQQRLINNLDASVIQDNLELLHKFEQFSERAEPEFNNFVRWANERGINLKQNLEGGQLNFWRWGFVPQHDQRQIGNFVDRLGYLRSVASRSRVENDNPIRDVFLPCRPLYKAREEDQFQPSHTMRKVGCILASVCSINLKGSWKVELGGPRWSRNPPHRLPRRLCRSPKLFLPSQ